MKTITLSTGQVSQLVKALTLCYCGGDDECEDCDARLDCIRMLTGIKHQVRHALGDNEGIVIEEEPLSVWDKIEEAMLTYEV